MKVKGVTTPPGEKHGDEACASLTGLATDEKNPLTESRGGTYAKCIGDTGPPKTILEGGAVVGACCTEVAIGIKVPEAA